MLYLRPYPNRAFTLIELLIVVAIIAILAAIAVPNFLEAQVRAKVSRAENDMRSIATGLEAYAVDNQNYPVARWVGWGNTIPLSARLVPLTTPIAYMTTIPPDPFSSEGGSRDVHDLVDDTFDYFDRKSYDIVPPWGEILDIFYSYEIKWRLASAGPDLAMEWGWARETSPYDATNGTISEGDLVRVQGGGNGWPWPQY